MRRAELCAVIGGVCILSIAANAQETAPTMRVVAGPGCAPVVLQPAGLDSASVAPFLAALTESLTRRFRPPTPEDTATRLVLTVTSDDIRLRVAGIYDTRIPPAARLAVAGAKTELAQFPARPGATPIELVATFTPRCVTEFAAPAPNPTEGAYFEFQVQQPAHQVSGRPPLYPPALREAHVEGRVLVQFVVDTLGRPETATFKVLMSSNDLLSAAVRDALPTMRYEPATIGDRRVRQVVQQPFTFAMQ